MWGAEQRLRDTITKPSSRDKQSRIGPSDLGNSCDYCLGEAMLGHRETKHIRAAWVGTCIHEWVERHEQNPDILNEQRYKDILEIPGYGYISGTSDRYDPYDKTVIDLKTTTKSRLATLKRELVIVDGEVVDMSAQMLAYYIQLNVYGIGAEQAGLDVEYVAIYFVVRDSSTHRDDYYLPFKYNPKAVEPYVERAARVYRQAKEDGLANLAIDPDCFQCMVAGR